MKPKPAHLGAGYASQFCDLSVASAYHARPPYPGETFDILESILPGLRPRRVLELGCGTGDLTLGLASRVELLDAVDFSAAMLAGARSRPGSGASGLRWHLKRAEAFDSAERYSLICAGTSLHWMDWEALFPRLRRLLHDEGLLAMATREVRERPWDPALREAIPRYSTNKDFEPFDLVEELASRGLFAERGRKTTAPEPFEQSLGDYVESFHSSNGFSRDRMEPRAAADFDELVVKLAAPHCPGGVVRGEVVGTVIWGRP